MLIKVLLFLSVARALVVALPLESPKAESSSSEPVRILINQYRVRKDGTYSFYYLTSDGQRRAETSKIYKEEGKDPITVVSGFYSYFDKDGTQYIVGFTSDQNGFRSNTVRVPKGQQELRSTGMREILEELEVDLDLPEEFLEYYPEVNL